MLDINNLHQKITDYIYTLDDTSANKFFRSLKPEDFALIDADENRRADLIDLKFLLIPFLPDKKVGGLLKENLEAGLYLEDIDIVERLKKRLIFNDLEDRDSLKNNLETSLLANHEEITKKIGFIDGKNVATVEEWLKDYISFNQAGDALARAQYLSERLKSLTVEEKKILKKLFDLYDYLDTSSLDMGGFEDDLLLKDEQGRLTTTKNGAVVVLFDPRKELTADRRPGESGREDDLFIEDREPETEPVAPAPTPFSATVVPAAPVVPAPQPVSETAELEQAIKNYSPASLEYKAVKQEISRLKAAALKQAQSTGRQSNAQK